MEKRSHERIPSNVMVHYYYKGAIYFGTVTNLSESGMFVHTKTVFAHIDSEFEIVIPSQHKELNIPVQVRRIAMKDNIYEGFGVEVANLSKEYFEFVNDLKASL